MERSGSILFVVVLILGVACSSGEKESPPAVAGSDQDAWAYYRQIDGMITEVMNKVNGFNRVLKTRDMNQVRSELAEVQRCLSDNADRASELGSFGGDTALNWAVLDLLEFYESLYTNNIPRMIEVGFAGDRTQYEGLNEVYRARLKEELPPLEKKYIEAEKAFAAEYHLTADGGASTQDKIDRHLKFQEKYGSQRDKERAKQIKEQLQDLNN